MIQMKHLLMQSIHLLDFSGIINDNMEGQLLLCPFFSLLSSLLLVSGSYTKTHVLLVNALYSAHIKSNWAIYSDLLWSLLIQLHSVFPLSGENSGSSRLHIDGSLEKLQNDLVSKPHAFGVCPSKIVLEGDSNIANYDRLNPMQQSEDRALEKSAVSGVHSFCSHISTLQSFRQEVETCKIDLQLTNTSFPLRVTEFPMSLCLIGRNLLSLSLMNLDLMSLPLTFGSVFRNLQKLDMSKNKLSNVPDSFAQLAALDHLILDDNIYESIPDIFGRLKSLKTLSAQRNQIQDMMALLDCTNLEVINLRKNKIERWPIDLPLRLPKLRSCKLSSME